MGMDINIMELMQAKKYIGHCCNNSFIVVDTRGLDISKDVKVSFSKKYIPHLGVDSVLFITETILHTLGMEVFEQDGSQSESCGNGVLLVSYIFGITEGNIFTNGGEIVISSNQEKITARMNLHESKVLGVGLTKDSMFVKVGEPHIVFLLDTIDLFNLKEMGKLLQNEYPEGVNVDFIQKINDSLYLINTYERGVNDITKSCGTGSLSAYLATSFFNNKNYTAPIEFRSTGGSHWVSRDENMLKLEVEKNFCEFEVLEI